MRRNNVEAEVRRVESRVASAEAVQRLSLTVQFESLSKAERLRKLGLAYQRSFATRKQGRARAALFQFLNTLATPFHKSLPARDMKRVKAFLRRKRR